MERYPDSRTGIDDKRRQVRINYIQKCPFSGIFIRKKKARIHSKGSGFFDIDFLPYSGIDDKRRQVRINYIQKCPFSGIFIRKKKARIHSKGSGFFDIDFLPYSAVQCLPFSVRMVMHRAKTRSSTGYSPMEIFSDRKPDTGGMVVLPR